MSTETRWLWFAGTAAVIGWGMFLFIFWLFLKVVEERDRARLGIRESGSGEPNG